MTRHASNGRRSDTRPDSVAEALCEASLGDAERGAVAGSDLLGDVVKDSCSLGAPCAERIECERDVVPVERGDWGISL